MAYEIHIDRFNPSFDNKLPITNGEWEKCADTIDGIKYTGSAIQVFNSSDKQWGPIFWVDNPTEASMRSTGFFDDDIVYEKAIEIADYLGAIIYGDEEEVYYLPNYGVVYDNLELEEQPTIKLSDLRMVHHVKNDITTDDIEELIKQRETKVIEASSTLVKEVAEPANALKDWWKFW